MTILLKPPSVKLTLHSEPKFTFKTKTKNLFSSLSNNIKKDRCLEEQENILRYRRSISSIRTKYNVSRVAYFFSGFNVYHVTGNQWTTQLWKFDVLETRGHKTTFTNSCSVYFVFLCGNDMDEWLERMKILRGILRIQNCTSQTRRDKSEITFLSIRTLLVPRAAGLPKLTAAWHEKKVVIWLGYTGRLADNGKRELFEWLG